MTIKRHEDFADDRLRAAVAFGFGGTQEDAAEFSGKSVSTVKRYKEDAAIQRIIEAIAAYKSIQASKQINSTVADVVSSSEDRIKSLFNRSLKLSEKALERAEQEGDAITYEKLIAIHENFTKWASKYAASEAPKRMQIEGSVLHEHKHFLPYTQVKQAILTGQEIDQNIGRPLIAGESNVIDAETIGN